MLRVLSLILFVAALSGCSERQATSYSSTKPFHSDQLEGQVRYEHVDSNGTIVSKTALPDPFKHDYKKGFWTTFAKHNVTTLGDPDYKNRINIVFLGDGYTQKELSKFEDDVDENLELMEEQEPFKTYRRYFAFHRIDLISEESGISEETPGVVKKTALEMRFNCQGIDRLLCANLNKTVVAAQSAPQVDSILALANSKKYGGSGYRSPDVATFAAGNSHSLELALHEFAHSFADLADEYDEGDTDNNDCEKANVAGIDVAQMKAQKTKWHQWLTLPHIGAFKGACYTKAMFRPTANSKMRSLGQPFHEVNTEQFILKIYEKVRPVEWATPPGELKSHQTIRFKPMRPRGHSLKVEWTLNGNPLKTFAGVNSISTRKFKFKKGKNIIAATVMDPTPLVRDEAARQRLMTIRLEWTFNER